MNRNIKNKIACLSVWLIVTILSIANSMIYGQGSLYFPAFVPSNVRHAELWKQNVPYKEFFFETVIKPKQAQCLCYGFSDGDGGKHNFLLGYESDNTHYRITGNFWTGTEVFTFGTINYIGRLNEWAHIAVSYDGAYVRVFFNDVVVSSTPYIGTHISDGGNLFVGGSYHLNCGCNIARFRYVDGNAVHVNDFQSEPVFGQRVYTDHTQTVNVLATAIGDYTTPSEYFPDHSRNREHDGVFTRSPFESQDVPFPVFQNDRPNYAPYGSYTPAIVPQNALVFDSFNRPNSSYFNGIPTLGQTEGGSLGQLSWSVTGWGIVNEAAYAGYNTNNFAVLNTGRTNISERVNTTLDSQTTALTVRYINSSNNITVYSQPYYTGGLQIATVIIVNGSATNVPVYVSSVNELRVDTIDNIVKVYVDGALKFTTAIPNELSSATQDGLAYAGPMSFYDNFVIYPIE